MSPFDIQIANQQTIVEIDCVLLRRAIEAVLQDARIKAANISLAVVDNQQIQTLNVAHLQHDYATDVLSFVFEASPQLVDGEIVVSAEMAANVAAKLGVTAMEELALYVVHGTLHLVGHGDKTPDARDQMIQRERKVLAELGIAAPVERTLPIGFSDTALASENCPDRGDS